MKLWKKALIVFCVVAVLLGSGAYVLFRPIALPPERELLYEAEPEADPLRTFYEVNGIGGSRFFIQSPKADALESVPVSQFGASPLAKDNAAALNRAFAYCRNHPGTRLYFDKKDVYYVSNELRISELENVCIDGNGAKIQYDYCNGLIDVYDCECLEIRDLTIDWDWDKKPLSALARAVDVLGQKNTIDFIFDVPAYAREDILYAISECDEETGTYGAKGTIIETYDGQNADVIKRVTKIGDDTLRLEHNGALTRFAGKRFILRSDVYGGSLIRLDKNCQHVTLDGLNLYGGTGMGIIVGGRSSHFALRNIFIGPDPEYADVRPTSLDADAVHINDADGCFIIEDCDFSRQGDDDVNINSGIGIVQSVDGDTITMIADGSMPTEPGDTVVFRDKNFNLTEYSAVVEECEPLAGKLRKITFRDKLPAKIKKGYMFFNKDCTGGNYVIRNNYFHEHRARGLLLQTPDGLVENNTFYKLSHDAIRIVMDISTGLWNEGTGADNIEIRNNTFIECGVIGTEVIEIGTHIGGKTGTAYAFTNIRIENNDFREICGHLIFANNVNNLVFSNNTVTIGSTYQPDVSQGRAYFMRSCANVDLSGNTYTDAKSPFTRIVRSNSPFVWLRTNASAWFGKGGKK